jgi:hypothetical protein
VSRAGVPAPILALLAFLSLSLAVAGCAAATGSATPAGSGCSADSKASGTFATLEKLLPTQLEGRPPDLVDSGANCTSSALGRYATHAISELRFAGATWDGANGDGTVIALMSTQTPAQPALQVAWVEEFYTAGAQNASHTENITTTRPSMPGAGLVFRLETLNNLSLQTVVVWPDGLDVWVVIVATTVDPNASRAAHDQRVEAAVAAAAAMPAP